MNNFELHPKLKEDTLLVTELNFSLLLLMNDQRFPWLVLVPKKAGLTELYSLSQNELSLLSMEIKIVSLMLHRIYHPDKLNIASIGNIVSQLHVHIVGRYHQDSVWPQAVFGQGKAIPYPPEKLTGLIEELKESLHEISNNITNKNHE